MNQEKLQTQVEIENAKLTHEVIQAQQAQQQAPQPGAPNGNQ